LCPVRNCRSPLLHGARRRLFCERGHSFDIARSGYINLLQPQDRRSHRPGDTAAAIAARRRLHDRGLTRPLLRGIAALLEPSNKDVVLDAGCGEGFYLGTLAQNHGCAAAGVDISVTAIEAAAKRYPECTWIVANADRFVPFADRTFSVVMSITARRNASEFRRVLRDDGRLLIAVPAPEDLLELRGAGRDRTAGAIKEFGDHFTLTSQSRVTTTAPVDAATIEDVLHSTYRPLRSRPVEATSLTFSLDLLLFRPSIPGNDSSGF
jgi:23S rRNA (guanine745-N1)-methyltransferase